MVDELTAESLNTGKKIASISLDTIIEVISYLKNNTQIKDKSIGDTLGSGEHSMKEMNEKGIQLSGTEKIDDKELVDLLKKNLRKDGIQFCVNPIKKEDGTKSFDVLVPTKQLEAFQSCMVKTANQYTNKKPTLKQKIKKYKQKSMQIEKEKSKERTKTKTQNRAI